MKKIGYEQLLALAMTTAFKLAKENDDDELLILADFLTLLGSSLILIHDRKELDDTAADKTDQKT